MRGGAELFKGVSMRLLDQLQQLVSGEGRKGYLLAADDFISQVQLCFLQLLNFFFDGAPGDQFEDCYRLPLTDAVCTVGRLVLCRSIPPGIKVNDDIRSGEVQPGSACPQ